MAASIFDFVAEALESRAGLAKLEARGTIRLALKESGLDARSVTASQMAVVLAKVLPKELEVRGVEDAATLCADVAQSLAAGREHDDARAVESPEAIFRRLAES
jgi:hypothetical protein